MNFSTLHRKYVCFVEQYCVGLKQKRVAISLWFGVSLLIARMYLIVFFVFNKECEECEDMKIFLQLLPDMVI